MTIDGCFTVINFLSLNYFQPPDAYSTNIGQLDEILARFHKQTLSRNLNPTSDQLS